MRKLVLPVRILVTGSRDWGDSDWIRRELAGVLADLPGTWTTKAHPPLLVHGGNGCRREGGYLSSPVVQADALADRAWREWGLPVQIHWAPWETHGKTAGFIRNATMVKAGATLCLAFIRDHSRGATDCAARAEKAGIPVRRFHTPALAGIR